MEKLILKNPEKYKGYAKHPTQDKTIYQVVRASISNCPHLTSWYDLRIEFENDIVFYNSAGSVKGCKLMFAFQCCAGSKWETIKK